MCTHHFNSERRQTQASQTEGPGTYMRACRTVTPWKSVQFSKAHENDSQFEYLCHSTVVRALTLTILAPRSTIALFVYCGEQLCHDVWSRSSICNALGSEHSSSRVISEFPLAVTSFSNNCKPN
jgi:hypothetical protein